MSSRDTVRNAKKYIWDFGDGGPEMRLPILHKHMRDVGGTYRVRLVAISSPQPATLPDTSYPGFIRVRNDPQAWILLSPNWILRIIIIPFRQLVFPHGKVFTDTSFTWKF